MVCTDVYSQIARLAENIIMYNELKRDAVD